MSGTITGELRTAMNVDREYTMGGDVVARMYCIGRDKFTDLCDAIDAVHANLERENESLRRELDRVLGEQDRDGWVELPKDADGETIHIGDVLQWPDDGDTFEVIGIGDDGVLFYFDPDTEGETADWTVSQNKRHYHEPTVEDVLQKLLEQAVGYSDAHTTVALNAIAEYAAKLRLAGDAS